MMKACRRSVAVNCDSSGMVKREVATRSGSQRKEEKRKEGSEGGPAVALKEGGSREWWLHLERHAKKKVAQEQGGQSSF